MNEQINHFFQIIGMITTSLLILSGIILFITFQQYEADASYQDSLDFYKERSERYSSLRDVIITITENYCQRIHNKSVAYCQPIESCFGETTLIKGIMCSDKYVNYTEIQFK